MAQPSKCRGSSVVERIIGNDEVGSSILPRGTSFLSKQVIEDCSKDPLRHQLSLQAIHANHSLKPDCARTKISNQFNLFFAFRLYGLGMNRFEAA